MAEAVQEKSRGLKFAEQLLLSQGWEQGKGLGRAENGISEAIKVKVKCDKGGIGHREGEQFSFHWWDHVFNKASTSLQVETDQNGITLKKTAEDDEEEDGAISNKKPRKSLKDKSKLYGCFVKSATLLSGQEEPEPKSTTSGDGSSSDEEEEQKLDLSSSTRLSDADLMKVCGGRTAHKGARHGLTMSAKLARLERQEAEFLAKYGKKNQTGSPSAASVPETPPAEGKTCRKKRTSEKPPESRGEPNGGAGGESPKTDTQPKKKKKKKKDKNEGADKGLILVGNDEDHWSGRRKNVEELEEDGGHLSAGEQNVGSQVRRKKKKKKCSQQDVELAETEDIPSDPRTQEEAAAAVAPKKQRKKRNEELRCPAEKPADEELLPPPKKKKKLKQR